MIVGTAGHIDHGKTTLVHALTGINADRLPEEKARGITLDLGYAWLPLDAAAAAAGSRCIGFVDVPGHEKLIHNMLAGATGIDYVLLVVAADDGPMPQTREHLELLGLLGLRAGAVALTKIDGVSASRCAAAENEVAELLAGSVLAGAPVFPLSAPTGAGVAALRAHLCAQALHLGHRPVDGRFRLAIDRCFSLAGAGTVVTGTVHSGLVRVGDALLLSPAGTRVRVRSLHVHDRAATQARAGERCALALVGDIERRDIARGMWLVDPEAHLPVSRFAAQIRVPAEQAAVQHGQSVHVHLGADDVLGRVVLLEGERLAPGDQALAEIDLARPVLAVRGDRFVLRDAGAQRSVGGGQVLDIFPPQRHKRSPARLAWLNDLCADDPAQALARAADGASAGIDLARYAANWNLDAAAAEALWQRSALVCVRGGRELHGFARAAWQALADRLLAQLAEEHARAPDLAGVERERLRRMTHANLARSAFDALVAELLAAGQLAQTRAWLHLPAHQVSLSAADTDLFASFKPLLDAQPYNPPRVRDIAHASGLAETIVRQLCRRLARAGALYPVAHDHYFSAEAVAHLARLVAQLAGEHGAVRAATLRDVIKGGRKVAIHILEFFDRIGYTRRVRDAHVLRHGALPGEWGTG